MRKKYLKNAWLTPAELVVIKFGGYRQVAEMMQLTYSCVHYWVRSGGNIPSQYQAILLEHAKLHNIDLSADQIIKGGIYVRLNFD